MSAATAKRRLAALSEQLVNPVGDQGKFEDIPVLKKIAPDSTAPRVQGKVVIVTGTNSPLGIGRASAHQFAQNGARAVYICDFSDSHLETHKREIVSLYPDVDIHVRRFDAADEDAVKSVVDEAVLTYGRLDIFFANAGIVGQPKMFTEISSDEFMHTLKTNVVSVHLAAKYAAPAMMLTSEEKKYPAGSIIATASVAGLRSNAGSSDYSASKSGVISLAQTISYQLAGTGIRVNAICPGVIETGMTAIMYEAARQKGTEKKIGQLNPLRRGAQADEVARVALFLGSEESSYVNGQAWAVDGGLSSGHPFVPGKLA
ncbi:hypothetical protein PZA11_006045 [Diplocarpon coronariae]|uniref:3-oxoacyl-(Acyl-carrier-protein) reductase n=1 Tax=Diplocarpon coronariae TaxID=2795749 RepID=A0A218YU39_9HELO|nr:hypothetical protein JHW43_005987 [Diplocarpon mali]OWO98239.1 hypothetical protein B2J93_8159 [Marssonina coronariae]